MRRCEMAEVSVAALLVCALVLQVRAQGNPEPCGNGGQCQTRCYASFSATTQTAQVNSGSCPSNAYRPACCTGAVPSWQWSQWSGCSGGSSCTQTRHQVCRAANGEDAVVQDCPVLMVSFFEQQPCPSTACFRVTEWSGWSPCSSRCSSGTRTRARSCVDSQGSFLPASSCGLSDSQLWQSEACDGKCDAYMWSAWRVTSQCNAQCLETVTRDCLFNSVTVDASFCSGLRQDTRPCAVSQTCPGYRWSDWQGQGTCDFNSCTEPVTRTCLDANGNPVTPSQCGGVTSSSRRCSCPTTSIYGWSAFKWAAWSGCLAGAMSEVRRRPCVVLTTDVVVPDFFCTGTSPSETRACVSTSSQYVWSTTQWGQWSGCGSGQVSETRRRVCVDLFSGNAALDFQCTGAPETETRACTTSQYGWSTTQWGQWSGCSGVQSTETRRRVCEDRYSGIVVSDFYCTATVPTESRSCQYVPSQWGSWSGCGSGTLTETRTRQCQDQISLTIVSSFNCYGYTMSESRNCSGVSQYGWSTTQWGQWSGCSGVQSTETRRRVCEDRYSGIVVSDFMCIGSPQTESRSCQYVPSQWGSWSGCGSGTLTETRTRQCQDQISLTIVSSFNCYGYTMSESRNCSGVSQYGWSTTQWGQWSGCSGVQSTETRRRVCEDRYSGIVVSDFYCTSTVPTESRSCQYVPSQWGSWSGCGSGTLTETRTRQCQDQISLTIVSSFNCYGYTMSESRNCSGVSQYGWSTTQWGQWSGCSGVQSTETRRRVCEDRYSGIVVSDFMCIGSPQTESRSCQYVPSQWGSWSGCGSGTLTETRTRQCQDQISLTIVSSFNCYGYTMSESRNCSGVTQYGWSTTQWGQWSGCSGVQSTETRRRVCEDRYSGIVVSDFMCIGSPQTESRSCQYVPSQWGSWSGCGSGTLTETRTRQCQDQISLTIVSSFNCYGYTMSESRNCSVVSQYGWSTTQWGQWSGCSGVQSTETRRRVCEDRYSGIVVSDFMCIGSPQTESRSCQYVPSQWGSWSGCGSGTLTETRTRQCQDQISLTIVSSFNCYGYTMSESRNCSGVTQYGWSTTQWGQWSGCSGVQSTETRRRVCEDRYSGIVVSDFYCTATVPTESRSCQYVPSQWGSWSGCGSGTLTETRTRQCQDQISLTIVSSFNCYGYTMSESRNCSGVSQYGWSTTQWGQWSGCSGVQSTETRRRVCEDRYSGIVVSDFYCLGSPQTESRSCQYVPSQWGSWSGCGSGTLTETRTRQCQDQISLTIVSSFNCYGYTMSESRNCSVVSQYGWSTTQWGQWSGCSGVQSTETRRRVCEDRYSGIVVSDFMCIGSPQTESRSCQYVPSQWGSWSGCGSGTLTETRTRQCQDQISLTIVSSFNCYGYTMSESRNCSGVSQYVWSTTQWGQWSGCGSGQVSETRRRVCEDRYSGIVVSDLFCTGSPQTESRSCQYGPTQWSAWSGCGTGAISETRTRQCQQLSSLTIVSSGFCTGYSMSESRNCSSYGWGEWSNFGACSAPCGQSGLQVRQRFCQDGSGKAVADNLCSGDQPSQSQPCTTVCTTWNTWGGWSSTCSYPNCTQTRTRSCPATSSCPGPDRELRACSTDQCGSSNYGSWSEWSACDRSCRQFRSRTCLSVTACSGISQESRVCETCPRVEVCGKFYYTEPRILNGNDSSTCRWPWMANIRTSAAGGGYSSLCSAVLIDQNTLVTSATCISRINSNMNNVQVVLNDGLGRNVDSQERVFAISSAYPHSSFSTTSANNVFSTGNVGIIQLSTPVGYSNECIQPVCLPDSSTQFSTSDNYIAAWGQTTLNGLTTDQLKEAGVKVTSGLTCSVSVSFSGRYSGPLPEDLLCSNYLRTDQAVTCPRDEGGMLVAQDTAGAWVLRGINVDSVCDVNMPNMFVDVNQYAGFLKAEMAKN